MTKVEHMPGPFTVNAMESIVDAHGRKVCHIGFSRKAGSSMRLTFEEVEANARLMAAAPDLLAALERVACSAGTAAALLAWTVPDEAKLFRADEAFARAVIARAKGRA